MITPEEYLCDPCGTAALAFWKESATIVPKHMRIVHERDFLKTYLADYADVSYFRLLHNLADIGEPAFPRGFVLREAIMPGDAATLSSLLSACYEGSVLTAENVIGFTHSPAYAPTLWLLLFDEAGVLCGAGLADYDANMREGILEWIQILPSFRGKGVGKAIVNELLMRLCACGARFATVSGRKHNPTNPEALYRACGFTGSDTWHVMTKKESHS
ncbi:MAG TPA: GNAT family N-acetyltransferase [Clostridia bacterium]|nr:GNAT family N-acetyltransferase [Clostridia bacterium]